MIRFLPSTIRQIENKKSNIKTLDNIFVLKNEKFAVQIELELESEIWIRLNRDRALPWNGLVKNFRIELVDSDFVVGEIYFEEAVLDDDGLYKKDRLVRRQSQSISAGYHNLWVELEAIKAGKSNITVNVYSSENFDDEILIATKSLPIEISTVEINGNNNFFLDLWQHLSSIARYYNVKLFSNRHFELIENFLIPLAQAGQKVCDLIVSDYSWAGQSCYNILENKSSLYEYNIIDVKLNNGELILDFSSFDRYLFLCKS